MVNRRCVTICQAVTHQYIHRCLEHIINLWRSTIKPANLSVCSWNDSTDWGNKMMKQLSNRLLCMKMALSKSGIIIIFIVIIINFPCKMFQYLPATITTHHSHNSCEWTVPPHFFLQKTYITKYVICFEQHKISTKMVQRCFTKICYATAMRWCINLPIEKNRMWFNET